MNIAVIDNWISPAGLRERTGKDILVLQVEDGECMLQADAGENHSHGTICSSILADSVPGCFILIGYSCSNDDGKADIHKVCAALGDCLKNPPAYISMSIGSENWLETDELGKITKELADAGTQIYAACANNGHIAFPAAYPWVTGVRCVSGKSGLYREENSPVGCDIVVGEFTPPVLKKLVVENPFFECRTNSMAAPYALGTMLSKRLVAADLPKWDEQRKMEPIDELPMPVVALRGPLEQMRELLALLQRENYQAALLTDRVQTDWTSMILHVTAGDFVKWVKPLEEAGILLLDIDSGLAPMQKYSDYFVDFSTTDIQTGYDSILQFFGGESE